MPNRDRVIIVALSPRDLRMIADGLMEAANQGDTVRVMIQSDGLKFKWIGHWTPPLGRVER